MPQGQNTFIVLEIDNKMSTVYLCGLTTLFGTFEETKKETSKSRETYKAPYRQQTGRGEAATQGSAAQGSSSRAKWEAQEAALRKPAAPWPKNKSKV